MLLSSLVVVALFVIRKRDGRDAPFLCPGYPVVPAVYLISSLGVACASAVAYPRQALYGLLLTAAGLPIYVLLERRNRRATGS